MFPLLRSGRDEVILSPCCKDELRPMDVILFRYKGKHLLHRILRREGDNLQLQGDGSFVAMENCTLTDVVGKVQTVVRPSGKQISVNSLQWRISSRVWRGTGIFRTFLLRILRRLIKKNSTTYIILLVRIAEEDKNFIYKLLNISKHAL